MQKHILLAGVAAGLTLACALPAAAQSIDYGSLQELFGEPVTTSATGSPQRSTETPADMQIISAEDIRRAGAYDLPTIISRVAGIDILNFSAGQADINVRGYNQASSPRLLVLINGRQVYLDHYGMTFWANLPVQLDEIRQIEVVKGPNSALFGFNAASGVVNIITYNPKFDDVKAVSLRAGSGEYASGSLVASTRLGERIGVRLSGGASRQNEWDNTVGVNSSGVVDPTSVSAALDVVAELAPKTDLRLEGAWSNVTGASVNGVDYLHLKVLAHTAKLTLTSDTSLGVVQFSAYQNDVSNKFVSRGAQWDNTTTVVALQDLVKFGANHTVRLSGEYRNNKLNTAPIDGGEVAYDVYSASAMWNWAISDALATTAAVRVDNLQLSRSGAFPANFPRADNRLWDRDLTTTSVNLGVVWRPTSLDTVRATYARGVQTPSLIEFGGLQAQVDVAPGVSIAAIGDPSIEPSIVTNYELSYDRALAALNAKAGVRVFWQQWEDVKSNLSPGGLDILPAPPTFGAISYSNTGDSEMFGAEVSASGKIDGGWRWSADYTYTDVQDEPEAGRNLVAALAAFERTTPQHRGNLALGWADAKWEADGYLHLVGESEGYVSGGMAKVDGYAALGARVAYTLADGPTLALTGQNLLNERERQTTGLEAERRVQLSVSKVW